MHSILRANDKYRRFSVSGNGTGVKKKIIGIVSVKKMK